jgi:hypothetical protein
MEMHVGSVDEAEHEQGIAHMIEHVAFLGSKKREKLLGTGARSNAYTDFHHTVFHVHSPVTTQVAFLPCPHTHQPGFFFYQFCDVTTGEIGKEPNLATVQQGQ